MSTFIYNIIKDIVDIGKDKLFFYINKNYTCWYNYINPFILETTLQLTNLQTHHLPHNSPIRLGPIQPVKLVTVHQHIVVVLLQLQITREVMGSVGY